jgi:hypothetical protein
VCAAHKPTLGPCRFAAVVRAHRGAPTPWECTPPTNSSASLRSMSRKPPVASSVRDLHRCRRPPLKHLRADRSKVCRADLRDTARASVPSHAPRPVAGMQASNAPPRECAHLRRPSARTPLRRARPSAPRIAGPFHRRSCRDRSCSSGRQAPRPWARSGPVHRSRQRVSSLALWDRCPLSTSTHPCRSL